MTCYLWIKKEVVVEPSITNRIASEKRYIDYYCVDDSYTSKDLKYGMFTPNGWKSLAFENFPAEFKVHLLLLGVT